VASGRCRAIVRVPWEDELAPGNPGPIELSHLRTEARGVRCSAGVVASGLGAERLGEETARPGESEVSDRE